MKYLKSFVHWLKPVGTGAHQIKQLGGHLLRDIGIDPIAVQYQRDVLLWQQLAA